MSSLSSTVLNTGIVILLLVANTAGNPASEYQTTYFLPDTNWIGEDLPINDVANHHGANVLRCDAMRCEKRERETKTFLRLVMDTWRGNVTTQAKRTVFNGE